MLYPLALDPLLWEHLSIDEGNDDAGRVCRECGAENPPGFRFCGSCGAPLAEAPATEAEERKLVSVLFVDLVGYTAASDRADPEDVRARLRPYHQLLKQEIERFGGTVEKFIGDAVMAVFGAPIAHEDDAERAVRSGLRILEAVSELGIEVRAAVVTGEAIVSLAARPERGEGIATGDVVNTASRLQNEAPPGSLVVGDVTYRATRDTIEYEQLEPVRVKGKAEPLPIWRALRARGRFGVDVSAPPRTPFVGRDDDLAVLTSAFSRTMREASAQLVTIVGEPGVGKTRIVAELRRFVDDRAELVFWRQGRCLPYGEGITFWALSEIVKAHAGILESDGPEVVGAKLAAVVDSTSDEEFDQIWLRDRLLPLVGSRDALVAEREESFAAWRRFLEAVAAQRPLVLVVEDLHWADSAMLDFLEHLVGWSSGVPLLLVCTARPELYDRVPGWGGGKRNSTSLSLSPLAGDDIVRLLSALLSQSVLPAETQTVLLERCGGNPLYAEEFVRMLADRRVLRRVNGHVELEADGDVAVPETVQALIAARLDALAPGLKALLHDAAVMGKVFWSGAVASLAGVDRRTADEGLHELALRELVRPSRTSSVEGDSEYAFWHVLVRDVAYGQIPRRARIDKHLAAAAWIEELTRERITDHAEFLAHHYREALDLAQAVGASDEARALEPRTRGFLVLAGDRASRLDMSAAVAYYREALRLSSPGEPDRGKILTKVAEACWSDGQFSVAEQAASEAVAEFHSSGEILGEGEALVHLAVTLWMRGEITRSGELLREAIDLLEREAPGAELARAYAQLARDEMVAAHAEAAVAYAEKALPLARSTGMDSQVALALQALGCARCMLGDFSGLDDLRQARRLSLELGLGNEIARSHHNLGTFVWLAEGPAAAHEVFVAGVEDSEQRGLATSVIWGKTHMIWTLFELGRWDELAAVADELESWDPRGEYPGTWAKVWRTHVQVRRGEIGADDLDLLLARSRAIADPQVLGPALIAGALVEHGGGDTEAALRLLEELAEGWRSDAPIYRAPLPDALRVAVASARLDLAKRLLGLVAFTSPRDDHIALTGRALLAEAEGALEQAVTLYRKAASCWKEYGTVHEQAYALMGAGRCLAVLGRPGEAAPALEQAKAIFSSLRATPVEREVNELLADVA